MSFAERLNTSRGRVGLHARAVQATIVCAFVVLFSSRPLVAQTEVFLDNDEPGTSSTGFWFPFDAEDDWGPTIRVTLRGESNASYRYRLDVPRSGSYEIFLWWPSSSQLSRNVVAEVRYDGGTSRVDVDQTKDGGQWNSIGTWAFDNRVDLTIEANGRGRTAADGLRAVLVDDNEAPTATITSVSPNPVHEGETVSLEGEASDSDGKVVEWLWTSSIDGEIGTQEDVSLATLSPGTHKITFVVRDDSDAWSENASASLVVEPPNEPPTATIVEISPKTAFEGDPINFDGRGQDADGTVTDYVWRSDLDGNLSTQEDFSTPALSPGTHTITFLVKDDDDAWSDEISETVIVSEIPNQPPTAQILDINPDPAPFGTPVTFVGSGLDNDGEITRFDWDSDLDGSLSNEESFTTDALSIGVHDITLRVRDDDSEWSPRVSRILEIHPPANTELSLVSPEEESTPNPPSVTLEVQIEDPEGETVDVAFYGRRSGLRESVSTGEEFTIIALPDTQNYVRNGTWPHVFQTQIDWILANQEAEDIVFVSHVGDIVFTADSEDEWNLADGILEQLDGTIPYAISPGNHDQDVHLDGTETIYPQYFPPSRFEDYEWYAGNFPPGTNWNSYQLFSAGGVDFIFVHVQFCPTAEDIEWASTVLSAHPSRFGVVTTHGYTDKFGNRGVNLCPDTEYIWTDLLVPNDNVHLLLCGHMREENVRSDFVGDREVHQVMANYQDQPKGGSGWLRILRFIPAEDRIDFRTYSTWLDEYRTDSASEFSLSVPLHSFERLGDVEGVASGSTISIPWDDLSGSTTYEWFATATDPNGGKIQSDIWEFTTAPGKPIATIVDVSPNPGLQNLEITFDGSASDPGGSVERFEWSSDRDGLLSEDEDFTTTSLSPGTHVISFRVADNEDFWSDTATYELVVEETPPTATIVAVTPTPAEEGSSVSFDGTASDLGGEVLEYEWISDVDGMLADAEDFSTTSLSPGLHVISFRVRDNDDLWSPVVTFELFVEERFGPPAGFRRGDPNLDGSVDLSDGVYILNFLFSDGDTPLCLGAADTDDTGDVDISDAIALFGFLFLGAAEPAPPGPYTCGDDPTRIGVSCETYGLCD